MTQYKKKILTGKFSNPKLERLIQLFEGISPKSTEFGEQGFVNDNLAAAMKVLVEP